MDDLENKNSDKPREPKEITHNNFNENGLSGLLSKYYNSSPFNALFEADLVKQEDEKYMRSHWHTH